MVTQIQAYEDFGEVQDTAVRTNINAMKTFQVHYTNFMFYTINVGTPGFIEEGVYNTLRADKRLDFVPFFRWRMGPVVYTGRKLDFLVEASSRGFFIIKMPNTFSYTRDGRFFLDSKRRLVTMSGAYPVMGEEGEIYVPEGNKHDITCARSGQLYMNGEPFAKFKIAVFKSFREMQSMDTLNGSFFVLTRELETLEGEEYYSITQEYLEENNVLKAITGDILLAKNAYDANAKTAHLINKAVNNVSGIASP